MNRSKLEIIYSIGILIAIPLIVIANTLVVAQTTNNAFNTEFRRKADLSNSVIAEASTDLIIDKNYEKLQSNLDDIEQKQPSVIQSTIIVDKNGELNVVAYSKSASKTINEDFQTAIEVAINKKASIAILIDTYDKNDNKAQAWKVITPVIVDEKVIAVVSSALLTVDAQDAINSAYFQSFIVLAISIVLILILLFRHFRLVGYAQLLAKEKEVNQTMSNFLSVATHELKAPTTIIKGYLSNIIEGDFGPVDPKIVDQINVALSQTERLNSLVKDLLNVSRVDQGRIQYDIQPVNTTNIITMIVENYKPIAREKNIELIFDGMQTVPSARADEGRIQEIFTNLIDNAIKYTARGSVTITQKVQKGYLYVSVRDTGFGMSPEARKQLFQRFYRVKTDQTAGIPGTGLGLWIIKQYAQAMGGDIDVETMENVGSNFIVKLKLN